MDKSKETASYVSILRHSLEKKLNLLDAIVKENENQLDVLRDVNALPEELEHTVDRKADLIDEISSLDEGFEEVFSRVKSEISGNKAAYKEDISVLQTLIRQISDRSAQIEAQELRNSEVAKDKFTYIKDQVKKITKSQKAVNSYYQSMMKVNYVDPQFMDNKK